MASFGHDDLRVILEKLKRGPATSMVRCPTTEDGQLASTYGYNAQTHVFQSRRMGTTLTAKNSPRCFRPCKQAFDC